MFAYNNPFVGIGDDNDDGDDDGDADDGDGDGDGDDDDDAVFPLKCGQHLFTKFFKISALSPAVSAPSFVLSFTSCCRSHLVVTIRIFILVAKEWPCGSLGLDSTKLLKMASPTRTIHLTWQ